MDPPPAVRRKQTPSPSPLQRMQYPFTRRLSATSVPYRFRRQYRLGIFTLTFVVIFAALNELRCLKYDCMSRVNFYGGEDMSGMDDGSADTNRHTNTEVFVGGGSVLPVHWKLAVGNGDGEDGNGAPVQTPSAEKTDAVGPDEQGGDDKVVLVSQGGGWTGGEYDSSGYASSFDKAYPVGA